MEPDSNPQIWTKTLKGAKTRRQVAGKEEKGCKSRQICKDRAQIRNNQLERDRVHRETLLYQKELLEMEK
jgi:hypothetical protein